MSDSVVKTLFSKVCLVERQHRHSDMCMPIAVVVIPQETSSKVQLKLDQNVGVEMTTGETRELARILLEAADCLDHCEIQPPEKNLSYSFDECDTIPATD